MVSRISKSLKPSSSQPLLPLIYAHLFSSSTLNSISSNGADPISLTVSFLTKSCGLPLESAVVASRKVQFETLEKPKSILKFLRSRGLKNEQIEKLISVRPGILCCDLEETIKPTIKVFKSLGISGTTLDEIVKKHPGALSSHVNKVLELLRSFGFRADQIKALIMKNPPILMIGVDKNLKPKLEYLRELGISDSSIATMLVMKPYFIERSLEKHIKPSVQLLKNLFGSNENMLRAVLGFSRVLEANIRPVLEPNISTLLSRGVPESNIFKFFTFQPCPLFISNNRLVEAVDRASEMGFDPKKILFVLAVRAMGCANESLWKQKFEAYSSFGLSGDEFLLAFRAQPMIMSVSVKKIMTMMDFYLKKLRMKPSAICRDPNLILLSLENRLIPRCSILELLLSKKLIKAPMSPSYVFKMTEKGFKDRFITKYTHELPEIVRAYHGKLKFQEFTWTEEQYFET